MVLVVWLFRVETHGKICRHCVVLRQEDAAG